MWDEDLPSPPGNPEFESYPESFKRLVAERFSRGIRLGKERDEKTRDSLERVRATLRLQ